MLPRVQRGPLESTAEGKQPHDTDSGDPPTKRPAWAQCVAARDECDHRPNFLPRACKC